MSDNDDVTKLPDIRDLFPKFEPLRYTEPPQPFHPPPADTGWKRHRIPDLVQETMGLTDQEAATAALSAPIKWGTDETETLESVLAGEHYDRGTLSDLVEKMMDGEPELKPKDPEPHRVFQAAIQSYDSEGGSTPLEPAPPPVRESGVARLPEMGTLDVGDWWNRK